MMNVAGGTVKIAVALDDACKVVEDTARLRRDAGLHLETRDKKSGKFIDSHVDRGLTSPVTYPCLLLASEPAPQAKCQKSEGTGIRSTGSLDFFLFIVCGFGVLPLFPSNSHQKPSFTDEIHATEQAKQNLSPQGPMADVPRSGQKTSKRDLSKRR